MIFTSYFRVCNISCLCAVVLTAIFSALNQLSAYKRELESFKTLKKPTSIKAQMLHRVLDKSSYIQYSIYIQPFCKNPLQFTYLFTAFLFSEG